MKKQQWTVLGLAALLTIGLYILTQSQIFGPKAAKGETGSTVHAADDGHDHEASLTTDTILARSRNRLNSAQRSRLDLLEHSITRGDVADQKLHLYHQLAGFWRDTARLFEPFAWYTAEAARLENSEKTLTFAAHLFLSNLREEESPELQQWKALQAKDLFERSLQINPSNDSSQIGLGATILFGGLGSPMEGVGKIRAVAERDSTNVFAQQTLGEASLLSRQFGKAIERFERVASLQPGNLNVLLLLADLCEREGRKPEALAWYRRAQPMIGEGELRKSVGQRVKELEKSK